MNLKEAYAVLGLTPGASPEELKKKYRELTKKNHPDVNKEPGAEDKFKKINEAHQIIQNGKGTDPQSRMPQGGIHRQTFVQLENVDIGLSISFKESVLGCKRDIKYSRQGKCQDCSGNGEVKLNNGCKKCNGKGQIIKNQGNMVMVTTCPECFGQSNIAVCTVCAGDGTVNSEVTVNITVPAGILNGTTLRLQGMGNYAGSFMGFHDQFTDACCYVQVIPESGLAIEGRNVVSYLTISLTDALQGCSRKVKTIHGDKEIQIIPKSRNKDEISIPNCGVGGNNPQRIILDVQYPIDIDALLDVLANSAYPMVR